MKVGYVQSFGQSSPAATYLYHVASHVNADGVLLPKLTACNYRNFDIQLHGSVQVDLWRVLTLQNSNSIISQLTNNRRITQKIDLLAGIFITNEEQV